MTQPQIFLTDDIEDLSLNLWFPAFGEHCSSTHISITLSEVIYEFLMSGIPLHSTCIKAILSGAAETDVIVCHL